MMSNNYIGKTKIGTFIVNMIIDTIAFLITLPFIIIGMIIDNIPEIIIAMACTIIVYKLIWC